ncbi:hypothetical protein NQZ68_026410 [Dissostichus eleginoides]|nr:hypothetical protein NQZ68_026410 [Dissostichus eleginoides]
MLKYSISQLLSLNNSSTPSSTSVIRHLGLLRRPRYIHRSNRRSFVYFQHGQSIASICSTQRTVAHLTRHQNATPTAPLTLSPAHLHSQLHVIPGADSTPLRLPTHITSHFSPPSSPPPLLHRPPSRAHPRAANLDNLIPLQPATTPPTPHLTNARCGCRPLYQPGALWLPATLPARRTVAAGHSTSPAHCGCGPARCEQC